MKQEYSFILSLWLFVSLCSPVCQKEYLRLASFWKLVVAQDTDLGSIPAPGSMSQLAADVQAGVHCHLPHHSSSVPGWKWGSMTIATLSLVLVSLFSVLWNYIWKKATGIGIIWQVFFFFFEGIKAVGIVLTLSVSCRILLSPQY